MGITTKHPLYTVPSNILTNQFIIPKHYRTYLESYYLRKYNGETLAHIISTKPFRFESYIHWIFLDCTHQEIIENSTEEFWVSFRKEQGTKIELALISKNYRPLNTVNQESAS